MARHESRRERVTLTQEIVKDLLDYIPETGKFYWKPRPIKYCEPKEGSSRTAIWNKRNIDAHLAGKEAFPTTDNNGYHDGKVFDDVYRAHRIAFLWMEGRWPDQIDHVNGIRTDNRWDNLKEVNGQQNMMNKAKYLSNKSGVTGVHWHKTSWQATIRVNNKRIHILTTKDFDLACQARWEAEEIYGFTKKHGREIPNEN